MVVTNSTPGQIVKLLISDDPLNPTFVGIGSASTAAARSDTSLLKEGARLSTTSNGSSAGVSYIRGILNSVTGTADIYVEVGTFDTATADTGVLYEREITKPIAHLGSANTRYTRFNSVEVSNTEKKVITDTGLKQVAGWFAGNDFTEPGYVGWGTELILDACGTVDVAPNNWSESADATTPTVELGNFEEGISSIGMGKDGVASSVAGYERDLASTIDASDAEEFRIWINFKDVDDYNKLASGTALAISVRSDSANIKKIGFEKDDLFVGWQRLKVKISDMLDQGSPDMSAIDYLGLAWNMSSATATVTHGNFLMDYWSFYKSIDESDTALYDEQTRGTVTTKQKVDNVARFKLDLDKAAGNTFNYVNTGLFNAITAGDMFLEGENIRIKKNSNTKIIQEVSIKTAIDP